MTWWHQEKKKVNVKCRAKKQGGQKQECKLLIQWKLVQLTSRVLNLKNSAVFFFLRKNDQCWPYPLYYVVAHGYLYIEYSIYSIKFTPWTAVTASVHLSAVMASPAALAGSIGPRRHRPRVVVALPPTSRWPYIRSFEIIIIILFSGLRGFQVFGHGLGHRSGEKLRLPENAGQKYWIRVLYSNHNQR